MLLKLYLKFLDFLERHGRKYALVDFYGDVLMYRYFILYVERQDDPRFVARFPNVWTHILPRDASGRGPDGISPHRHPWSAVGLILRGHYVELLNNTKERRTAVGQLAYTSYKDDHRVLTVGKDTLTIFFHGFRRATWTKVGYPCKTICSTCKSKNNGKCLSTLGEYPLPPVDPDPGGRLGSARTVKWVKVTKDFNEQLQKRKAALSRRGHPIPILIEDKLAIELEKMAAAAAAATTAVASAAASDGGISS